MNHVDNERSYYHIHFPNGLNIFEYSFYEYLENGSNVFTIEKYFPSTLTNGVFGIVQHINGQIGIAKLSLYPNGNVAISAYDYNINFRGALKILWIAN